MPLRRLLVILFLSILAVACSRRAADVNAEKPAVTSGQAAASKDCLRNGVDTCGKDLETAVLAGGCFWGMEEILREIPGVVATDVGYTGGTSAAPSYDDVRTGETGHAESVRIVFDPKKLSYSDLLEKWFFRMHDPTTKNRQGNDIGTQYRSAIFFTTPQQKSVAEAVKKKVESTGKWDAPLSTEIVAAGKFTRAEDYHQKYLQKNPGGYTCHYMRD
jgi:peptide methionine sulfoxide reductase msrA/msrB